MGGAVNGFIDRLLARAVEPSLRPRPRSLFEPIPAPAAAPGFEDPAPQPRPAVAPGEAWPTALPDPLTPRPFSEMPGTSMLAPDATGDAFADDRVDPTDVEPCEPGHRGPAGPKGVRAAARDEAAPQPALRPQEPAPLPGRVPLGIVVERDDVPAGLAPDGPASENAAHGASGLAEQSAPSAPPYAAEAERATITVPSPRAARIASVARAPSEVRSSDVPSPRPASARAAPHDPPAPSGDRPGERRLMDAAPAAASPMAPGLADSRSRAPSGYPRTPEPVIEVGPSALHGLVRQMVVAPRRGALATPPLARAPARPAAGDVASGFERPAPAEAPSAMAGESGAPPAPAAATPQPQRVAPASRAEGAAPALRPPPTRLPEPTEAPPASRSVHITIGRVEVRAVQAPRAAAQTQREQPVMMSLDDYLARRAGHERRAHE